MDTNKLILLFDGNCNLCNSAIRFIIKHEKDDLIIFSSLQSDYAKSLSIKQQIDINSINSIVLISNDKVYLKSAAIFKICDHIKMPFAAVKYFSFLPTFITDFFYNLIANTRYSIFGKREQCFIPKNFDKNRFIT